MEEFDSRYLEVMVHPEHLNAARALKPIHERQVFGRSVMLFEVPIANNSPRLAKSAGPSIADSVRRGDGEGRRSRQDRDRTENRGGR